MLRRRALTAAAGMVAVLAFACSSGGDGGKSGSATPDGEDLTRDAEAGGVTVEGTWLTEAAADGLDADLASYPLDEYVLLEIDFTTHSGDLNSIEMEQAAGLKRADEAAVPVAWVSLSDDSHHRAGVLVFERTEADGPVELTLDMGGEEVVLLWESPPA